MRFFCARYAVVCFVLLAPLSSTLAQRVSPPAPVSETSAPAQAPKNNLSLEKLPMFTELREALKHPRKVYRLSLKGITILPSDISKFVALRELHLSGCSLAVVPEVIPHLTKLEVLSLRDNQLRNLPESIRLLTQLKQLDVSDNQLSSLPASLTRLSSLHTLLLVDNQFTELPTVLTELKSLENLQVRGNPINPLVLSEKELSDTPLFESMEQALMSPEKVYRLQLSNIREIPKDLLLLTQLRELRLSNANQG